MAAIDITALQKSQIRREARDAYRRALKLSIEPRRRYFIRLVFGRAVAYRRKVVTIGVKDNLEYSVDRKGIVYCNNPNPDTEKHPWVSVLGYSLRHVREQCDIYEALCSNSKRMNFTWALPPDLNPLLNVVRQFAH